MNMIRTVGFLIVLLITAQVGIGHDGHKNSKVHHDSTRHDSTSTLSYSLKHAGEKSDSLNQEAGQFMASMPAPLEVYPTFHPMVVHIPIVLLLLAALLQLIVFFRPSEPLNWLTLLVALGGSVGAYIAGTYVHPHTDGLSDAAQMVLETHETYADYTIWLGFAGTILKGITLWRPLKWVEAFTAIALVGAGISVGLAGHQGGALTYLYGIGPRGAYLEQHEAGTADGDRHKHK